ncbi:hypothetical protein [Capsulimonas corticalis]|nr:hypothetical protein [Capsulimonas corticalis]
MEFTSLLQLMIDRSATDMHLAAGLPPVLRVDGALLPAEEAASPLPDPETSPLAAVLFPRGSDTAYPRVRAHSTRLPNFDQGQIQALLEPLLSSQQQKSIAANYAARILVEHDKSFFLVTVFGGSRQWTAAVRRLISKAPTLTDLQFPATTSWMVQKPQGLMLVTGSQARDTKTTAAALLNGINMSRTLRALTIESDPGYLQTSKMSMVTQMFVGLDIASAADGLRLARDCDMELVYIDDLADGDTLRCALDLMNAGCAVIAAGPAKDTSTAINRLIDRSADAAASVRSCLSEHLCAAIAQHRIPNTKGGGSHIAYEILLGTPSVKKLIAAGERDFRPAMRAGQDAHMITMADAVRQYYERGFITKETMMECIAEFQADVADDC